MAWLKDFRQERSWHVFRNMKNNSRSCCDNVGGVSKAKSRLRLKSQSCDISLKIKKGVLILSLLKFKDSERNWGK